MTIRLASLALLGLIAAAAPVLAEESPPPLEGPRRMLLEKETDTEGVRLKTRVMQVSLPTGYKTPLHTHESPGPRYVLKGRIRIQESGHSQVYGPGDAFWETGQWMTAENVGEEPVELLIVEITGGR